MTKTEIYFISGSPPCWSIMLALTLKGLSFAPRRLNNSKREHKSASFLDINPRGTVPVLVDNEITVRETNAILAYLDAAYPNAPLFGTNAAQTAEVWQIVCEAGHRLRTPIGNTVRPIFRGRAEEMEVEIKASMEPVYQELKAFDLVLSKHPYLCGKEITAADVVVYPALMQLLRGATRAGAEALELQVMPLDIYYPNLASWVQQIEAIPGYDATYPPHWR